MAIEQFRVLITQYRRAAGFSQQILADAIGLHEQVLSRKLRGNSPARLTHAEIKKIILTLADWKAITRWDQATELLEHCGLKTNIFSNEELAGYPLSELENPSVVLSAVQEVSTPSANSSTTTLATYNKPALADTLRFNNLPVQLTSLVGREWVVERICEILAEPDTHLLSLIGPGGCGKTRLAVKVGQVLENTFDEGVCFVNLAEVAEASWVGSAIAQALGLASIEPPDQLKNMKDFLREKQLLLILDNFEHLTEAAGLVEELLKSAPGIKIIVTTRVVLRLYGEREFTVPTLHLPAAGEPVNSANYQNYDAVQLFIERVKAVKSDLYITDETAWQAAKIATLLNGLPLALELAASRVKMLPLPVLLDRLSAHKLDLLSNGSRNLPTRQRTLRNTLDWSYRLLDSAGQKLYRELGIFRGSFSLEEVQVVCSEAFEDGDNNIVRVLDLLSELLDNSLIIPTVPNEATYGFSFPDNKLVVSNRFRMLETLREYALEKVTEANELTELKLAQLQYYRRVLENARVKLNGPEQDQWLDFIDSCFPNIRTAFESALSFTELADSNQQVRDSFILDGLRMCRNLASYWDIRGLYAEGKLICNQMLETARQAGLQGTAEFTWALSTSGNMTGRLGEFGHSEAILKESVELFEKLGDTTGEATTLNLLGAYMDLRGDVQQALRQFSRAEEICRQSNDNTTLASVLIGVAVLHKSIGNYTLATEKLHQALAIFKEQGNKRWIGTALQNLGATALIQGQFNTALFYLNQCLYIHLEQGDYRSLAYNYRELATVAYFQVDYSGAENYLVESMRLSYRIGDKYQIGMTLALMAILNVAKYELEAADNPAGKGNHFLLAAARLMGGCEAQLNMARAIINPTYQSAYDESVLKTRKGLGEVEFTANYTKGLTAPPGLILKNF